MRALQEIQVRRDKIEEDIGWRGEVETEDSGE